MSEPAKKKQKIANKTRNVDNNSMKLEVSKNNEINYFERLFCYDWFLIEIGRKLMTNNDENLINILLLNHKINEKATPVFRENFLNFKLQSQIFDRVKSKKFKEIQKTFSIKSLALNPNINFTYGLTDKAKKCVHDVKLKQFIENLDFKEPLFWNELKSCNCGVFRPTVHLSIMASRSTGLESLIKSILFHPRMNFSSELETPYGIQSKMQEFTELLNWSVVNGHLDLVQFILKLPRIFLSRVSANITIFAAILYNRLEILKVLTDYYVSNPSLLLFNSTPLHYLEACSKIGGVEKGPKFYELILKCHPIDNEIWKTLSQSCKYGKEFVQVVAKSILINNPNPIPNISLKAIPSSLLDTVDQAMKLLSECVISSVSEQQQEEGMVALRFAFSMGFEKEFQGLLDEREWSERNLLDIFQSNLFDLPAEKSRKNLFSLILNRLDPQKSYPESDFETLLNCALKQIDNVECFKLIWNDKRFVRTKDWTNKFALKIIQKHFHVFQLILPECSLSEKIEFKLKIAEIEQTKTVEIRQAFFLTLICGNYWDNVYELCKLIKLDWSLELLDLLISLELDIIKMSDFVLSIEQIPKEWKMKMVHSFLLTVCKEKHCGVFKKLLERFPEADLRANNNELFKYALLIGAKRVEYMAFLEVSDLIQSFGKSKTFRFKDEDERNEILKLVKFERFADAIRELILNIKIDK